MATRLVPSSVRWKMDGSNSVAEVYMLVNAKSWEVPAKATKYFTLLNVKVVPAATFYG